MDKAWHLFNIRRALLTSHHLGFAFGVNAEIRLPEIHSAAASILYVNAVSLLSEAAATRMTQNELRKYTGLNMKLNALNDRGDILDFRALNSIRKRRNEIGHEQNKDASVAELNA